MDFWGNLSNVLASVMAAALGIVSVVIPNIAPPEIIPTPTPTEIIQQDLITRSGEITYSGQSVRYIINVPKNGGLVTGSISGVCEGGISGNFDGGEGGKISGHANPSCGIAFVRQTFNVSFNGQLYLKQGKVDLNWLGNVPSTPGKGSFIYNFEPEK